jgi:hypothetical protein
MLRVPRIYPSDTGAWKIERTIMGNAAVAGELAGIDDLEELYKLSASENEPEDDEDDEEDEEEDEDEGMKPGVMPQP